MLINELSISDLDLIFVIDDLERKFFRRTHVCQGVHDCAAEQMAGRFLPRFGVAGRTTTAGSLTVSAGSLLHFPDLQIWKGAWFAGTTSGLEHQVQTLTNYKFQSGYATDPFVPPDQYKLTYT